MSKKAQKKQQITFQNLLKQDNITTGSQIYNLPSLNKLTLDNLSGGIKTTTKNYFPTWLGGQKKRYNNFDKFYNFYGNMNNLSTQQKKELAQQDPAILGYNQQKDAWTGVLGRQANAMKRRQNPQRRNNIEKRTTQLINKTVTSQQIQNSVPAIVRQIVNANDMFSQYGIGPVSSRKFPLYAGRWIDQVTGSLKMLPKASAKYLNPASYSQRKQYMQARIINKWNQFVMVVQQYAKFSQKDSAKWQQKQLTQAAKRFQKQKQTIGLPTKIINQYKKYTLGLPMSQAGTLFWTNVNESEIEVLKKLIVKAVQVFAPKQVQDQANSNKLKKEAASALIVQAQVMLNSIVKKITNIDPKPQVQAAILSYGYSFANSKLINIRNNLMKVAKILNIPANISQVQFQKVQKQLQQDKQSITKILKDKKGFTNKSFPKLQMGVGKFSDILKKAETIDRVYNTGTIQDIVKRKAKPQLWKGFSFGGLKSSGYQGNNLISNNKPMIQSKFAKGNGKQWLDNNLNADEVKLIFNTATTNDDNIKLFKKRLDGVPGPIIQKAVTKYASKYSGNNAPSKYVQRLSKLGDQIETLTKDGGQDGVQA